MRYFIFFILLNIPYLFASSAELRSEKILLSTDKTQYNPGDTICLSGILLEANTLQQSLYSNYAYVELLGRNDSVLTRQKLVCDSARFTSRIPLDPEISPNDYYIRAYTRLMCNYSPTAFTTLVIPVGCKVVIRSSGNKTEQVHFYPEGGHLTTGALQNVAFEIVDQKGFPVETTVALCRNSGDTVYSALQTDKHGIGRFSFIPEKSSHYFIQVGDQSYPCPPASSKPALQLNLNNAQLHYNILFTPENQTAYQFILFHGGEICLQQTVTHQNKEGLIKLSHHHQGLITGILLDEQHQIVSETLCYFNKPDTSNHFSATEKAILLNTDLSRPLPDAEAYIEANTPGAANNLQTYLMTRKWGRFSWQTLLQNTFIYRHKPEIVMTLTGRVETESGKLLRKGLLIAINKNNGFTYEADINNGLFTMGVDNFKEGDSFYMQAYNEKGKSFGYKVMPDNDTFPGVINLYKAFYMKGDIPDSQTQIDSTSIYYTHNDRGDKIYHLPSVTVTARIKEKVIPTKEFYGVNYIGEEEFESPSSPSLIHYLERMIGFRVIRYQDKNRDTGIGSESDKYIIQSTRGMSKLTNPVSGNSEEIVILLDEKPVDTTWAIESIDVSDVRSIERLTPTQALRYTSQAFSGAILIRTKTYKKKKIESQGIIYTPLGLSNMK